MAAVTAGTRPSVREARLGIPIRTHGCAEAVQYGGALHTCLAFYSFYSWKLGRSDPWKNPPSIPRAPSLVSPGIGCVGAAPTPSTTAVYDAARYSQNYCSVKKPLNHRSSSRVLITPSILRLESDEHQPRRIRLRGCRHRPGRGAD